MSTPRTKRQFAGSAADPAQRQITSFFSSRATPPGTTLSPEAQAQAASSHHHHQSPPSLPPSVQANLLSVGMRIRKSVPEGYKTRGPSAFKLWTDPSPCSSSTRTTTTTSPRRRTGELLPYCGINKVGGLGTQPAFVREDTPISDDGYDEALPDANAVPGLTLSQESIQSEGAASEPPSRKRVYDENEPPAEPTVLLVGPLEKGWDEQVSPRTVGPCDRLMAVPRSRVRKSPPFFGLGRENAGGEEADFEEADFLVFGEGAREMDLS